MIKFATILCTVFWLLFSVLIWVIGDESSFWVAEGILSVAILVSWIGIVGSGDDDDDSRSGGNTYLPMATFAMVTVLL